MFEQKTLKQAYTLTRLQDNTLTHRRYSSNPTKQTYQPIAYAHQSKPYTPTSYNKNLSGSSSNTSKPFSNGLLPTPPPYNTNPINRTTRPIRNKDLDERRAKGQCFWCDEKFIPCHRCQNKRLYSLCIVEKDGECSDGDEVIEEEHVTHNPHLSLNALEGVAGLNTLRVTGRVEKQPLFILVDSGSTHNFISNQVAERLHCRLTSIKALIVQVADGGLMICYSVCNNFQWSMQGVSFETDVYTLDLQNCDMILGIQWLAKLKTIVYNYKEMWMAFIWQGQEVCIKGDKPTLVETIQVEQLNGMLCNTSLIAEISLYSLHSIDSTGNEEQPMSTKLQPCALHHTGLTALQVSYQEIFEEPKHLPPPRSHDHQIPLKESTDPVNLRPYRHSSLQKDVVEKMIQEMLDSRTIQHSRSPFASPIVLVKKKDGSWRLCIDYRALNKLTVKDKFYIPLINELLEELIGATIFSKIDLKSGYHQIRMSHEDVYKTTFKSHNGHYEFLVMPFGLTNALATFQSLMNEIFRSYLRKFIIVFFDDILIYSNTLSDHLGHLQTVFEILKTNDLYAKASKCVFCSNQIEYFGHVIS